MTSNVVLSTEEFNVVGTRPIRHDGTDKVTGRARYSADINLPGLLYGAVLRSPHAHAWIRSIDPSRALALPGVKCVVSGTDFAEPSGKVADLAEGAIHNLGFLARNVMAKEKALYKGHAVAAVAATSLQIAEEALGLIDVEYEVLPPVTNAADAMKADAPILHERLANLSNPGLRPGGFKDEDDTAKSSNIANHFMLEVGDVEEGFKGADLVVEREFTTASVHQGYIEPHSATASWSEDGNITIWCGSQGQFTMRDQSARLLGIPASKVKVIPLEIGGGFGGKTIVYLEPIAGALAKKSGHPVKVSMSRTDVFQATGPTSGTKIRVKMGVTKDGRICAADATLIYESGAFPGSPAIPGSQCMFSNYDIPNARVEGLDVVVAAAVAELGDGGCLGGRVRPDGRHGPGAAGHRRQHLAVAVGHGADVQPRVHPGDPAGVDRRPLRRVGRRGGHGRGDARLRAAQRPSWATVALGGTLSALLVLGSIVAAS